MSFRVVLDPSEYAVGRSELQINEGPIRIGPDGVDWGDAEIQAYLADESVGSRQVDSRIPTRTITIPLFLGADDGSGYAEAKAALQQKVALIQKEGGFLKRGDVGRYADLIGATLHVPDKYGEVAGLEPDVTLTLMAIPDFYGAEETLDVITGTGASATVLQQAGVAAVVKGDYPGRVRIKVTDTSGNDQMGGWWGFRARNYDAAITAADIYEAEALTPLDASAVVSDADCSGGEGVQHTSIDRTWRSIISTDLLAGDAMTQVGSYRVIVRAKSTAGLPALRLLYAVGALTFPEENERAVIPLSNNMYILDLGGIRIEKPPIGNHRWKGNIQAKTTDPAVAVGDITIDQVMYVPLDEFSGQATALIGTADGLSSRVAFDDFDTGIIGVGNLDGDAAPLGGTWDSHTTGTGTTDFVTQTAGGHTDVYPGHPGNTSIIRSNPSTESPWEALLGVTAYDNISWQFNFYSEDPTKTVHSAEIRVDTGSGNRLSASLSGPGSTFPNTTFELGYWDGSRHTLASEEIALVAFRWYTLKITAFSNGTAIAQVIDATSGTVIRELSATASALAAGGAVASGLFGVIDDTGSAGALDRVYDNFSAEVPAELDAVVFSGKSAEYRTDGCFREDSDGSGAYGPMTTLRDALPRIPVSGKEDRPIEFFYKTSRGDFATIPDSALDSYTITLKYNPSFLFPTPS